MKLAPAKTTILAAALLCSGCLASTAAAQRLVVVTQAFSAVQEAASSYLQSVDFAASQPLPGPILLPKPQPAGPLLLSADASEAILSTTSPGAALAQPDTARATWHTTVKTAPFGLEQNAALPLDAEWQTWAALSLPPHAGLPAAYLVLGTRPGPARGIGKLELYTEAAALERELILPGAPIDAIQLAPGTIALLCHGNEGPQVFRYHRASGALEAIWSPAPMGEALDTAPAALAKSDDGRQLFVLLTGFSLSGGLAEPQCWLYCLDLATGQPISAPITVPGAALPRLQTLQAAGDAGAWIFTMTPGTRFAHASYAQIEEGVLQKRRAYSLPDAAPGARLAAAPRGVAAAVAIGNRLEIWPLGERGVLAHTYPQPLTFLKWTASGLIAGAGNRLYLVDPLTAAPAEERVFQSGLIADALVMPPSAYPVDDYDGDGLGSVQEQRLNTNPENPDSDGDGIHDGIDPEPMTPSPRLSLPAQVVFRGDRAGRELRGMLIQPPYGLESPWQVNYPAQTLPWLNLRPLTGLGWSPIFMGIDPARQRATETDSGHIEITMQGTRPPYQAAGSPQIVYTAVTHDQPGPPQILWIWDSPAAGGLRATSDPRGLKALADLLAAPPHYFIHHELAGPMQQPLQPYNVVVLDAAAAARGAVTRQAVLDYVAAGGALLFLGAALPEAESRPLVNWLQPAGIRIYTDSPVNGRFPAPTREPLTAFWEDFNLQDGARLEADDTAYIQVPAPGENAGVLLAREYGYGRIALLAAAGPLQSAALEHSAHRLFAQDLFQWLVRAGYDVSDMDGDGLTDAVEDPNNNGQRDPGETHYLLADTDEDGIPDGMEDMNRNGKLDEGETDPRNRDSDSDGIFDGADPSPVPIRGAPYLERVELAEGPAEGGNVVLLTGRNLVPGLQVYFGERAAASQRYINSNLMLVEAPPYPQAAGGVVPIRLELPAQEQPVELADAYTYTARTKAVLTVENASGPSRIEGEIHGSVLVRWESSQPAAVQQIFLMLRAEPATGMTWLPAQPAADGPQAPNPVARPLENGMQIVVVVPGEGAQRVPPGALLYAPYRYQGDALPEQWRIQIQRASVQLSSGELLAVETHPLSLNTATQSPQVPRREIQ